MGATIGGTVIAPTAAMRVTRILVPLDGSRLAEAVLPAACSVAIKLGAGVSLLHVLEREPPETVHGEPHLGTDEEARAYLEDHAATLRARDIAVETHVHERPVGDVAAAIDRHAHELESDLIAMCAHGRTNLRTRLVGSIAERILRGGSIPILLRTVRGAEAATFDLRRVLVPLDFGHDIDAALDAARALARPYEAGIVLLSALEPASPPAQLLPGTTALTRELDLDALGRRLDKLAEELRTAVPEVRTVVERRRPSDAILAASDALGTDLIVLVTDAHGGLSGWYDPSTAQRLLSHPGLTLLLIKEL
jgi:nucleotide-binding universal stress UspA family protein